MQIRDSVLLVAFLASNQSASTSLEIGKMAELLGLDRAVIDGLVDYWVHKGCLHRVNRHFARISYDGIDGVHRWLEAGSHTEEIARVMKNDIAELKMHVAALSHAVKSDPKFFVSISYYVDQMSELVNGDGSNFSKGALGVAVNKVEGFFAKYRPSGSTLYIPPVQTSNMDETVRSIKNTVDQLMLLDDESARALFVAPKNSFQKNTAAPRQKTCVFIGHGRSTLWALVERHLEKELGVETVNYESSSRVGQSIVPILEEMLDRATFAVIIMTAEDKTGDGEARARQNVVHEIGLFQGRLGFGRVVLLRQSGVEEFTNISGLQYIPFTEGDISRTFDELRKTMKREEQIN